MEVDLHLYVYTYVYYFFNIKTNKILFHNKCFFKNSIVATLAASLFDADWCHLRIKWPVLHSKAETEKSRNSLYSFLPCITKLTRFYLDAKIKPFKKNDIIPTKSISYYDVIISIHPSHACVSLH